MTQTCIICKKELCPADPSRSFHRFPLNNKMRQKWMEAVGIQEFKKHYRICSDHFEDDAYHQTDGYIKIRRLVSNAVPVLQTNKQTNPPSDQIPNVIVVPRLVVENDSKNCPIKDESSETTLESSSENDANNFINKVENPRSVDNSDYSDDLVSEDVHELSCSQPKSIEIRNDMTSINYKSKQSTTNECPLPNKRFRFMDGHQCLYVSRKDFVSDEAWGRFIKLMRHQTRFMTTARRRIWSTRRQLSKCKEMVKQLLKTNKLTAADQVKTPQSKNNSNNGISGIKIQADKPKIKNTKAKAKELDVKNEFDDVGVVKEENEGCYEVNLDYVDAGNVEERTNKKETISEENTSVNDKGNVMKHNDEVKIESEFVEEVQEGYIEYDDDDNMKYEYLEDMDCEDITEKTSVDEDIKNSGKISQEKIKGVKEQLTPKYIYMKRKMNYKVFMKLCSTVKISDDERQRCIDLTRRSQEYLISNYRCNECTVYFNVKAEYENHLEDYHSESNTYKCELCAARFSSELLLSEHVINHNYKYVCAFCNYERLHKKLVYDHLSHEHSMTYSCYACGIKFGENHEECVSHFKRMHTKFICDKCGCVETTRQRLIGHMGEYHTDHTCKLCNLTYSRRQYLKAHEAFYHSNEASEASEEAFCVECNKQFYSVALYQRHIKTSPKHRVKRTSRSYQCSECPNVYARITYLNMHYKLKHLNKTNYYCDKCCKYFMSKHKLKRHIDALHLKIAPPKDKICSYCGRGFSANRILENHIRTHTGERPFSCSHCTASFTQKAALVTHARAKHKDMIRCATKEKKCNNTGT